MQDLYHQQWFLYFGLTNLILRILHRHEERKRNAIPLGCSNGQTDLYHKGFSVFGLGIERQRISKGPIDGKSYSLGLPL